MADDFVKNILIEWGFETYVDLFKEEQINEEAFKLLETDTIKILFPKIGARLLFQQKHKNLISSTFVGVINENNADTDSTSTTTYNSESSVNSEIYIADDNVSLDIVNIPISYADLTEPSQPQPTQLQLQVIEQAQLQVQPAQRQATKRKFNESLEENSVFPGGLENIFKRTITGQTALNNKLCLTNDNRQKICNITVNELLSQTINGKVPTELFEKAAKEIVQLFPNEKKDSYFMSYIPKSNTSPRVLARGKLWSRYINAKRSLNASKKKNLLENNVAEKEPGIENKDSELTAELNFLKICIEPENQVEEYWTVTHEKRIQMCAHMTTAEYFDTFPALNTRTGYRLLLQDFNTLYPDKENLFYDKWPQLCHSLSKLARKKSVNICAGEGEDIEVNALKVFAYLFTPTTIINKKSAYRPSRTEIQESFFLHVQVSNELPDPCPNVVHISSNNCIYISPK